MTIQLTPEERERRAKWGLVGHWGNLAGKIYCWEVCAHSDGAQPPDRCEQCAYVRRADIVGDAIENVLSWSGPMSMPELVPHVRRQMQDDRVHMEDIRAAVMHGCDPEEGVNRFRFTDDWAVDLGDPSARQMPPAPEPKTFEGRFWDYGMCDGGWSVRDMADPLWRDLLTGSADAFNGYKVRVTIEVVGPKEDL